MRVVRSATALSSQIQKQKGTLVHHSFISLFAITCASMIYPLHNPIFQTLECSAQSFPICSILTVVKLQPCHPPTLNAFATALEAGTRWPSTAVHTVHRPTIVARFLAASSALVWPSIKPVHLRTRRIQTGNGGLFPFLATASRSSFIVSILR